MNYRPLSLAISLDLEYGPRALFSDRGEGFRSHGGQFQSLKGNKAQNGSSAPGRARKAHNPVTALFELHRRLRSEPGDEALGCGKCFPYLLDGGRDFHFKIEPPDGLIGPRGFDVAALIDL